MKLNKTVSIIIPAYNSERFLSKCIESVIGQTYKNIELVIVDDGSIDSTLKIAEYYASNYSYIKVVSKPNGGLSSARLYGLNCSSGNYLVFLDSDDYIEKDFVKKLIDYTSDREDEVVMCDFLLNGKKESENCQYLEMNSRSAIFDNYLKGGIYNRTVNKIYPRSIVSETDFPVGRDMLEDAFFTSHILEKCNHAIRIPYAGYNYIRHDGSISKSPLSKEKRAGMHSNILEKDIVLSRNISESNTPILADKIVKHIYNCFYSIRNTDLFLIKEKIYFLLCYVNNLELQDQCIKRFASYMIASNNKNKLKRQFAKYIFLKSDAHNKILLVKSFIRLYILNK